LGSQDIDFNLTLINNIIITSEQGKNMISQALSDIKVLSLGQGYTSPFCAKMLADYGADVIKIEPPEGDPARKLAPFFRDMPHLEKSGLFLFLNTLIPIWAATFITKKIRIVKKIRIEYIVIFVYT
jgi:hypothetical protein